VENPITYLSNMKNKYFARNIGFAIVNFQKDLTYYLKHTKLRIKY